MSDTDAEGLLKACCSRSPPEQAEAFARLGRRLYEVAWRQVRGDPRLEHLAEDCAQEALVTIWRRLEAGQGPERAASFLHWAAVIVTNKVREEIRRLDPTPAARPARRVALRLQTSLDAGAGDQKLPLAETLADDQAGPEAALRQRELLDLLAEIRTTTAISDASRTVLLKGYIEGWDDAELAAHLGTTRANVHVIRCRDLARLRDLPAFMQQLRRLAE
jgi:RNA polymerase sigma factor (sigma-70 family)